MGFLKWLTGGSEKKTDERKAAGSQQDMPAMKNNTHQEDAVKRQTPAAGGEKAAETQWTEDRIRQEIEVAMNEYVYITDAGKVLFEGTHIRALFSRHESMEYLIREARAEQPQAMWLMSLAYGIGLVDKVFASGEASNMLFNSAKENVLPALIYLADIYERNGNRDAAYTCINRIFEIGEDKSSTMAAMIATEWKIKDSMDREKRVDETMKLLFAARKGQWRAQQYLDQKGIDYRD